MPSLQRPEIPGGIFHINSHAVGDEKVFLTDEERELFVFELALTVVRKRWHCLSYCLLSTHYHLLIETPEPTRASGMRDLLSRFVLERNRLRGTNGRAFDDHYHSSHVNTDAYLACALRYVALNAFNAGLCSDPATYRWSNHGDLLAGRESPTAAVSRVEELLSVWGGQSGSRYARLLSPAHPGFGSWEDALKPTPPRPELTTLLTSSPLDEAIRAAISHGYRLREIADATGLSETTICRRARA